MSEENQKDSIEEELVTLEDFIQTEQAAEELLGGINENTCSYVEGYKYRQPLYSCLTCAQETGQKAGVCFACSLNCHDQHSLVEMFTKRKFCCDCGNSKFKNKCKLFAVCLLCIISFLGKK